MAKKSATKKAAKKKSAKNAAGQRKTPASGGRKTMLGSIAILTGANGSCWWWDEQAQQWNAKVVATLVPGADEWVFFENGGPNDPMGQAFSGGNASAWTALENVIGNTWSATISGLTFQPSGVRVRARFVGAKQTPEADISECPSARAAKKTKAKS